MGIITTSKEGKLSYSDLISEITFQNKYYENVTIENLMYIQIGLPDYMEIMNENWDKSKKIATNEDVIEILQTKPEEGI
jgi:hypothetical protein